MKGDQHSGTAQIVALQRAAHQLLDRPLVFEDPLAVPIVGGDVQARLRGRSAGALGGRLRAFVAARSRFAEDELARAVARGVRQYVVLGAGLDTFAYRSPYAEAVRVFEVDHPATQAWKRVRLADAHIALPAWLTFAPIDFDSQTLAEGLREAGLAGGEPVFFSCLGLTFYLPSEAVMATMRAIAALPRGSGVVFDYAVSPALLDPFRRALVHVLTRGLARAGEPWRSSFEPAALAKDLAATGFSRVEALGPEQLNARYFQDRADGLRVGRLAHLINAQV